MLSLGQNGKKLNHPKLRAHFLAMPASDKLLPLRVTVKVILHFVIRDLTTSRQLWLVHVMWLLHVQKHTTITLRGSVFWSRDSERDRKLPTRFSSPSEERLIVMGADTPMKYKMKQKKTEKLPKPWQMGTHLRALRESYPMNTNITGFRWFSKIFESLCLGRTSLSIGRVKHTHDISTLQGTCIMQHKMSHPSCYTIYHYPYRPHEPIRLRSGAPVSVSSYPLKLWMTTVITSAQSSHYCVNPRDTMLVLLIRRY